MGLPVAPLLVLALLLILFLIFSEGGGLGGAASWVFLLDCRSSGNDLEEEDGIFFSTSGCRLTAVSDDDTSAESRLGCSFTGVDGGVMYSLKGGTGGGLGDFDSTGCGSTRLVSTGFASYLYLKKRKRHITMATRARSKLDISTATFIGWQSDGGMFSSS